MPHIVMIVQDKGGPGKSVIVRALDEASREAPIGGIPASHRLSVRNWRSPSGAHATPTPPRSVRPRQGRTRRGG